MNLIKTIIDIAIIITIVYIIILFVTQADVASELGSEIRDMKFIENFMDSYNTHLTGD